MASTREEFDFADAQEHPIMPSNFFSTNSFLPASSSLKLYSRLMSWIISTLMRWNARPQQEVFIANFEDLHLASSPRMFL
jgi:hypothetical protein